MKIRKLLFVCAALWVFTLKAAAQGGIITGTVTDETKAFLPGATVWLKGTKQKVVTDINGKYTILSVPKGKNELQFTFIGYETQTIEVTLRDDETITRNIKMNLASILGKEVVISTQDRLQPSTDSSTHRELSVPYQVKNLLSCLMRMWQMPLGDFPA